MAKLIHDRGVAIESKDHMHEALVVSIDQQIDKLKALEKLQKLKDVAAQSDDFERAIKLREQLKHKQSEYDAEYKSSTADETNN